MKKPELLLPAGNPEAFHAALEGGADAIYLGLKSFNARGRAKNFTNTQLLTMIQTAEKKNAKIYLTLNTLIKNSELPELLDTLYLISQTKAGAVIIQDLGILFLIKKLFPKLSVHGSTQMGIHNSAGANFMQKCGLERVILARELTLKELHDISKRSSIELETFIHGALCYSFSGMCLFSSFLGGMSANRGLCRQPCRRIYNSNDGSGYIFSLKDNQLIEHIPELCKLGISSLKIEGRMKSADYVYKVASAYRMAIDDFSKIAEAKELLSEDLGREKTDYFMGNKVGQAITDSPYLGIECGNVEKIKDKFISFTTTYHLEKRNRLRILPKNGINSAAFKLIDFRVNGEVKDFAEPGDKITIAVSEMIYAKNDKIFLVGKEDQKFSSKIEFSKKKLKTTYPEDKKLNILKGIGSNKQLSKDQIFVRINSAAWLRKVHLDRIDYLIVNLTQKEWQTVQFDTPFLKKHQLKLIMELPKFIPEGELEFYRNLTRNLNKLGYKHFMISNLSQIEILPEGVAVSTNESVYCLNDAAIAYLHQHKIKIHTYPLENDFPNMIAGKDRKGIIPIYYFPELFYSRMPITGIEQDSEFTDKSEKFRMLIRDGVTVVLPVLPVSLIQYKKKMVEEGFHRFMLDLSYTKPSDNTFKTLMAKVMMSEAVQPSRVFNFKMGLT